jgi:hypothetical protein
MTVNLVDHRQETIGALAPAPMNLVHADRMDVFQLPVGQAPSHKPFHRAIDTFPTGAKNLCGLAPRQSPRPAGKEANHGDRHRPFAGTPGNMLDPHPMFRAVDPPRGVNEMRHQTPQRHKEPSTLRQVVVTRCRLATMGTPGRATRVRHEGYLQAGLAMQLIQEPNIMENKARKMLNGVQNSLNFQLHRWSRFRWFSFIFNSQTKRSRRDRRCLFSRPQPARRFQVKTSNRAAAEPPARARLRSSRAPCRSLRQQHPTKLKICPYPDLSQNLPANCATDP